METRDKFIHEYGKELFDRIFANIYGDRNDSDIIVDKNWYNQITSYGTVTVEFEDEDLVVEFVDGDSNGSEIISYELQ